MSQSSILDISKPSLSSSPRFRSSSSCSSPRTPRKRSTAPTQKVFGGKNTLISGVKINRCDPVFLITGQFDRLICNVGMVRAIFSSSPSITRSGNTQMLLNMSFLVEIQKNLNFISESVMSEEKKFDPSVISVVEQKSAELQSSLPPQKSIIPGSSVLESHIFMARSVCKDVERICWENKHRVDVPDACMKYLNRLADYFTFLAPFMLKVEGKQPERF